MTKTNEVIKALECLLNEKSPKYKKCLNCEYRRDVDHLMWQCRTDDIIRDALAFIGQMEAKVLALEELQKLDIFSVVYLEDIDKDEVIPAILCSVREDEFMFSTAHSGYIFPSNNDYNKRWRCWTLMPENDQRKNEKWDTSSRHEQIS